MLSHEIVRFSASLILVLLTLAAASPAGQVEYDPMAVPVAEVTEVLDLLVGDLERQRQIPIRVYLPSDSRPAPVVLFSHGLGGSREGSAYLGNHWAARGYAVVYLQHPGSDTSVWQDLPRWRRIRAEVTPSVRSAGWPFRGCS